MFRLFTFTLPLSVVLAALCSLTRAAGTRRGRAEDFPPGVQQVDEKCVQFSVEVPPPLAVLANAQSMLTFVWFLDTDLDATTGQSHGDLGSEYNVRAVLRRDHFAHAGGFVDGIDGREGAVVPMFFDGRRVTVRVTKRQLGDAPRFRWACEASLPAGNSGRMNQVQVFAWSGSLPETAKPSRVILEPNLSPLRDGTSSVNPTVRVYDRSGNRLKWKERSVSLFAYRGLVEITSGRLSARPASFGLDRVTAMVDGVLSSNVAEVMVGRFEVQPAVLHLDLGRRPTGKVVLKAGDARGKPVPIGQMGKLTIDNAEVASVSADGRITALATGKGKCAGVAGEIAGSPGAAGCVVRVLKEPAPLKKEVEIVGRYVSFWYPPLATDKNPPCCQFEEIIEVYDLVGTLDQIYLKMRELTGVRPFWGNRQCYAAVCTDSQYKLWGVAGNPIGLGFDPRTSANGVELGTSGVQLGYGKVFGGVYPPHWGVAAHEMGHNFVLVFREMERILFQGKLDSGLAYSEGLATICGICARTQLVQEPDHGGIPANTLASFQDPDVFDSLPYLHRVFVEERLAKYVRDGANYPADFDANVLDGMLTMLGEQHGWDIYRRFFSIFYPPTEPVDFSPRDEKQRATFFVAALSAAAKRDLRPTFKEWGVPCDDALLTKLAPNLVRRAAQRD